MRIFFLFFLFSLIGHNAESKIFSAKEFVLDNGLKVVIIENDKAPLVSQYLCYHAGRIDENSGKSGLAHLLEHMMFKGSNFSQEIDKLGGNDNAFTTNDMTCYHQNVASKHIETIIKMESDRMRNLSLKQNDFDDEKKVVIEERIERTDSKPSGVFRENLAKLFYKDTPYSVPTIGFLEEIKSLKREDLKDFYDKWYHPNNAVLAISGDVDFQKIKKLVEKYYGRFESQKMPDRVKISNDFDNKYSDEYSMKHKNVNQPNLIMKFHAPFYHDIKAKKYMYALDVFTEIIGGGTTSNLYQELVVNKKMLLSVSASYYFSSRISGEFVISAVLEKGFDKDTVIKEINAVIKKDITDKEIEKVRDRMKIDRIYLAEKPLSGAEIVAPILVNGIDLDVIENYDKNLYSFTTDDLNQFKKEVLKNPLIGWLLPND